MSRGGLECGHLGKFARRVTFPEIYSGEEERCHSLKALIHRVQNLLQLQKCNSLRIHSKADGYIPPPSFVLVWEAQGQSQSHREPPALLLGSIPHVFHLRLLTERASDLPAALTLTWAGGSRWRLGAWSSVAFTAY